MLFKKSVNLETVNDRVNARLATCKGYKNLSRKAQKYFRDRIMEEETKLIKKHK